MEGLILVVGFMVGCGWTYYMLVRPANELLSLKSQLIDGLYEELRVYGKR